MIFLLSLVSLSGILLVMGYVLINFINHIPNSTPDFLVYIINHKTYELLYIPKFPEKEIKAEFEVIS